jgi:hypothetical protein
MKILVMRFDPFEGELINPSWEAVRRLPDTVEGVEINKVQLPTSFGRSADVVRAAILEHDPDVVVNVGRQAANSLSARSASPSTSMTVGSPITTATSQSAHRYWLTGQRPTSAHCPSRRWSLP